MPKIKPGDFVLTHVCTIVQVTKINKDKRWKPIFATDEHGNLTYYHRDQVEVLK